MLRRLLSRRVLFALCIIGIIVYGLGSFMLSSLLRRTPGQFFNAGGTEIYYTVQGDGAPLILLHGFAVNSDLNWTLPGVSPALAGRYRVISMDLRGHGLSEKVRGSEAYGAAMGEDVIALMDHLGIEKAHLAGYSLGGTISLKLAVTHQDRFITINPLGAGWEADTDGGFFTAIEKIADSLEAGQGVPPLSKYLGGARKKPGFIHTWWVKIVTSRLNDGPALADMVRQLRGLTVTRTELENIDLPVCSIVGENDSMRAGVKAMRGIVPDLTVHIIEDADHISALKHPDFLPALYACLEINPREQTYNGH